MYKLYFVDKDKNKHFIKQGNDLNHIYEYQRSDMENRGFKSEYNSCWIENGGQWMDFGNWSCFYFIEGVTLEDMCK